MPDLSPAAQAVLNAAGRRYAVDGSLQDSVAAALRAFATRGEAVEIRTAPGMSEFDDVIRVSDVLAIAAELGGADG